MRYASDSVARITRYLAQLSYQSGRWDCGWDPRRLPAHVPYVGLSFSVTGLPVPYNRYWFPEPADLLTFAGFVAWLHHRLSDTEGCFGEWLCITLPGSGS